MQYLFLGIFYLKRKLTAYLTTLLGRAFYGAVRAENTTIAFQRTQHCAAIAAFIKNLAGIFRHGFLFTMPAFRAGDC